MDYIRGVLLVGGFRTHQEMNAMSLGDQRNTLIVELAKRTNRPVKYYQSLNDSELSRIGAVLVFIRVAKFRTDIELKTMSDTDLRNTLIVEISKQNKTPVSKIQSFNNGDLIILGLGGQPGPEFGF